MWGRGRCVKRREERQGHVEGVVDAKWDGLREGARRTCVNVGSGGSYGEANLEGEGRGSRREEGTERERRRRGGSEGEGAERGSGLGEARPAQS